MTTSCISCVHASHQNLQVYVLNDRSRGLKNSENVSSQKKIMLQMEIPPALESALIPLVTLLTCEKML